jgi:hypothetical protein
VLSEGAQTPAKTVPGLQRTLDVYWVIHNFVRGNKHYPADEKGNSGSQNVRVE